MIRSRLLARVFSCVVLTTYGMESVGILYADDTAPSPDSVTVATTSIVSRTPEAPAPVATPHQSANPTGRMLDNFKAQEGQMLFQNIPLKPDEEAALFSNSDQSSQLHGLLDTIESSKVDLLKKRETITHKRTTLEQMIQSIDDNIASNEKAIAETQSDIRAANAKIIDYLNEIHDNETRIATDQVSIRKYLAYIYSRGDLVYDTNQNADLLKTIIMNDGNVGDIFDDIHSKSLVELAGENFIEDYRRLVREYYYDKDRLTKERASLTNLKERLQESTNAIVAQRQYKEQLLDITKGKEDLFTVYIDQKHRYEKTLVERIQNLSQQYEDVFASAGARFQCKGIAAPAIGVSSSTSTGSADAVLDMSQLVASTNGKESPECDRIKQFFHAEEQLHAYVAQTRAQSGALAQSGVTQSGVLTQSGSTGSLLRWPVAPTRGITAYYHDDQYYALYGSEHEAIDIPTPQGSDIHAPMAGYVYYIHPPRDGDYGFIALKHANGMVTVYGHISEVTTQLFDFVKPGDVFAKSGGTPGTPGAGPATSGAHVHFEFWIDRKTVDPLRYLDLTELNFDQLPAKYNYKYIDDMRARYGPHANVEKYQRFIISGDTEIDRQQFLLAHYAAPDFQNWNMWVEESIAGKVDPSFTMCLGLAETSLGNHLKSAYNIGNVGNDDSGNVYEFDSPRTGVYWIIKTLNNAFLKKYRSIDQLSRYGNKDGSIYASSERNWHNNVVRCLSALKGRFVEDDFRFRTDEADQVPEGIAVPADVIGTPDALKAITN